MLPISIMKIFFMQINLLNTVNPEHITWQYEELQFSILGGIRLDGLDRMRVTIKIEHQWKALRHNLDLYNDLQTEKLVRRAAEKLEVGTSHISKALSELINLLEAYRLEQIEQNKKEQDIKKLLTEEERSTAIKNLKTPGLLEQTSHDLQQSGIQGEQENSMMLYIAMTSRKTADPLSVICLAKSGMGKSYLMEKVAECIPEEDRREHTQFTGNSFYYYRREEIRGKVFLIEDLDGAQAVLFPIRELQTKKRISKTVTVKTKNGQLRTVTLIVEGPVSVIGCTTKEQVYEDNANRAILIYLDNSKEQDERVMNYQKQHRAGITDAHKEKQVREKLQNMQRVLEPVKVINPYATQINLPKEIFKPRRTLPLLLSFIEAVTFYHQLQREQHVNESTGEIFIKVHPRDIEHSFLLLKNVLFRKSDELSGAAREFYQWLIQWESKKGIKSFYASDIREENRIHPRTLNRYLQELTEYGLLQITGGSRHKTGYSYALTSNSEYESLQQSINEQIEQTIKEVWNKYNETEQPKETKNKRSKTVGHRSDSKASVQLKPSSIEQ